ncbi:hypothetical protein [Streptomyces sp. BBFR109]|uniref:hypothetical protein n=1 Tax=Streptomyces sp. BBFR109 TaxID=3448172 RepID=UPI003F759FE0
MKQHLVERMLYIVLALVFLVSGVGAYFAVEGYTELKQQVARQDEVLTVVQQLLASQGKTTKEINKSLSCILALLGHKNSANYFISDFATCTITNKSTGGTEVLPLPKAPASVQPNAQKSGQSQGTIQQPATPPKQPSQGGTAGSPGGGTSNPPGSGDNQQPVRQLVQDIVSLPLALIRQIPIVGGKP